MVPDPLAVDAALVHEELAAYDPPWYRRASIIFCYLFSFFIGFGYGVTLPSMVTFIKTPKTADPPGLGGTSMMYTLAIAMYSVGEILGSLGFGWLANRISTKYVILIATPIGIAGNIIYAAASASWMVVLGRFMLGLLTGGMNSVLRSYLVRGSTARYRTLANTGWAMCAAVSMAIGPIVAIGFGQLDFKLGFLGLKANVYTVPGWLTALFCTFLFLSALFGFWELSHPLGHIKSLTSLEVVTEKKIWSPGLAPSYLVICEIWVFAVATIGFSMIETIIPPLLSLYWGVAINKTSYVYIVVGVAILVSGFTVSVLNWKLSERPLQTLAFCVGIIGLLLSSDFQAWSGPDRCHRFSCHTFYCNDTVADIGRGAAACLNHSSCQWNRFGQYGNCSTCAPVCHNPKKVLNLWMFIAGSCLLAFSFSCGRATTSSLYSQILRATLNQGSMTSFLVVGGSFARVAVPFFAVNLFDAVHSHTWPVMFTLIGVYSSALFIVLATWRVANSARYDKVKVMPVLLDEDFERQPLLHAHVN